MQQSEDKPASNEFDCSGAKDAVSKLRSFITQRRKALEEFAERNDTCESDLLVDEIDIFEGQVVLAFGPARADDANDSGVQETERSLLDEAINCLRERESLLDGRVRKYRCGNGPEWIADMWGNRHEETGMCVNELLKLKQNLQAKPSNTDKGLDARRSEVS